VADRFEDHRGIIQDLLVKPIDAVTEIFTKQGAIRGNHVHEHTTQWGYVVSGRLRVATQVPAQAQGVTDVMAVQFNHYGPGEMFCDNPGVAHAWQALEDCTVLVFTKGPRSGENYESDTRRLEGPLL
jgi:quercetin dioxygenase-like cupin family protein